MGIGDLFRPKYRHSDPGVRADAVRTLPDAETDLLMEVATHDDDPAVRALAIAKIGDPDALCNLSRAESKPDLKKMAADRAAGIWLALILDVEEEAPALPLVERLLALGHGRALAEVV